MCATVVAALLIKNDCVQWFPRRAQQNYIITMIAFGVPFEAARCTWYICAHWHRHRLWHWYYLLIMTTVLHFVLLMFRLCLTRLDGLVDRSVGRSGIAHGSWLVDWTSNALIISYYFSSSLIYLSSAVRLFTSNPNTENIQKKIAISVCIVVAFTFFFIFFATSIVSFGVFFFSLLF